MKITRKMGARLGVAVATALALAGSVCGEWGIDPDSTTREGSYEGDVDPATEGWTPVNSPAFTLETEGETDYIAMTNGHFQYTVANGKLDPTTNIGTNVIGGVAIEFRFRTWAIYPYFYFNLTSPTTGREYNLFTSLGNTYMRHYENNWTYMIEAGNLNAAPSWTTIRLVSDDTSMLGYKDGGNIDLELYNEADPDGVGDGDNVGLFASFGPKAEGMIRFDTYAGARMDLDYIRWTDGVPEPPPPPAGLLFRVR